MILAGGFGKRLMPLTRNIPKTLVNVGGKPILQWEIEWLESYGIREFVILGGYKAAKIINYVKSIGYSDRFEFSIEKKPLGSAGALRNAADMLKDDRQFLLVNGDNVTDINVKKLSLHGKSLCCIALKPYRSHAGVVQVRKNMVTYFEEKPIIKGYWINAGIALIDAALLKMLPKVGSLEYDIFPKLIKQRKLAGATFRDSYHKAIDSYKDYQQTDADLRSGKVKI